MEDEHNSDPIRFEGGKWYFWDETWCDKYGPFDSEEEARVELDKYCRANKLYGEEKTDG